MGSMIGYENHIVGSLISAGSETSALPASNLQTTDGCAAAGWQTAQTTTSWFQADTGNATSTFRAFCIANSNLTPTCTIRWRVGSAASFVEPQPIIDLDFDPASFVAPAGWSYSRSGTATRVGSNGRISTVAANSLRWNYDPNTLELLGLMAEDGRTNLCLASGDLSDATNWSLTGATVGSNTLTGPSGAVDMDRLTEDSSLGEHRATQGFIIGTAVPHAFSVFVRPAERTKCRLQIDATINSVASSIGCTFDLTAGTAGTVSTSGGFTSGGSLIEPFGMVSTSPLWRIQVVATPAAGTQVNMRLMLADASGATSYQGLGSRSVGWWGMQAEAGTVALSHIPTVSAPVSRGAESISISGLNITAPVTVAGRVTLSRTPITSLTRTWMNLDTGSASDRLCIRCENGSQTRMFTQIAGVTTHSAYAGAMVLGSPAWGAAAFAVGDGAIAARTSTVSTTSTGTALPGPLTSLWIGRDRSITSTMLQGSIRSLKVFDSRLANSQISSYATTGAPGSLIAPAYDSGPLLNTVVPGFQMSTHVAPADVQGQVVRCDIDDPDNTTDGHLNVAQAFAGPVYSPSTTDLDNASAVTRSVNETISVSRSGQEWFESSYSQRGYQISYANIPEAEIHSDILPLDAVARTGANLVFIPDASSPEGMARQTVLGRLRLTTDVQYLRSAYEARAVRMTIMERR